jgi:hypothetical protein
VRKFSSECGLSSGLSTARAQTCRTCWHVDRDTALLFSVCITVKSLQSEIGSSALESPEAEGGLHVVDTLLMRSQLPAWSTL